MKAAIDILNPDKPKRVAIVASNSALSPVTGWQVGFWWAELTHPYWVFLEHGYRVEVFSPDGGELRGDAWSDPRDPSGYSAEDLISLGFIHSPEHMKLVQSSRPLGDLRVQEHDALFLVGGQGPMVTFYDDMRVHELTAAFYEAGKVTALVCHATCVLLKARLSNSVLLVEGKTWTGFADSEEEYVETFVGKKVQPFRIQRQARALPNTNFIVSGPFKSHAVRDGLLVTGQQQNSGAAAAHLVIQALGV
jgi:putative intracellular protease/amidase